MAKLEQRLVTISDIRVGDCVRIAIDGHVAVVLAVKNVPSRSGSEVEIRIQYFHGAFDTYQADPGKPVLLLRREWPEGKTEQDMLAEVRACSVRVSELLDTSNSQAIQDHISDPGPAIEALVEAISAWRFGRTQK